MATSSIQSRISTLIVAISNAETQIKYANRLPVDQGLVSNALDALEILNDELWLQMQEAQNADRLAAR